MHYHKLITKYTKIAPQELRERIIKPIPVEIFSAGDAYAAFTYNMFSTGKTPAAAFKSAIDDVVADLHRYDRNPKTLSGNPGWFRRNSLDWQETLQEEYAQTRKHIRR